jgi:hypothetical protein
MRTIIYPEWLLDGTGGPARVGQALAFAEGRIEAVGPAEDMRVDDGDEVLRCPGETLLPGLINMHVHLSLASDNTPFVPYMDAHSDVALALRAAHNARVALEAGITTVRDCGARRTTVLELRNAQADGLLPAARIVSCGWPLTISGGHMRPFGGEVDGELGVRQMVRRIISAGADFIKVAGSGGGTPGSRRWRLACMSSRVLSNGPLLLGGFDRPRPQCADALDGRRGSKPLGDEIDSQEGTRPPQTRAAVDRHALSRRERLNDSG